MATAKPDAPETPANPTTELPAPTAVTVAAPVQAAKKAVAKKVVVKKAAAQKTAAKKAIAKKAIAKKTAETKTAVDAVAAKKPAPSKAAVKKAVKKAAVAPQTAKPAVPKGLKAAPKAAEKAQDKALDKTTKAKDKLVRDSFTMPRSDFALVDQLKQRAMGFQRATKKSELLRAGLHALAGLTDAQLKAALAALLPLKAGRPKREAK